MRFWRLFAIWFGLMLLHLAYIFWLSGLGLPTIFYQKPQQLSGYIVSLPEVSAHKTRFKFATEYGKLSVAWYQNAPVIMPGEKWQLQLKIKPPQGLHNPGLPDYANYLKAQGLVATAYVQAGDNQKLGMQIWRDPIDYGRYQIKQFLLAQTPNDQQGLFLALVLGDKSLMTADQWQVFWRTGTSHLVAISGLHIGLIAGLVYLLLRCLWAAIPSLSLRIPAQYAAMVAAWLAALVYSALAGFAVPTQRALIMISVLTCGKLLQRVVGIWQSWCMAALLVLLFDPWSITAPGTCLSFIAVACLLYCFSGRLGQLQGYRKWLYPQWVAFLGLLPVSLFWFQQLTLWDIIVNSIAIPVMSFIIVPGLLLCCGLFYVYLPAAHVLLQILAWVSARLWLMMCYFAHLPYWGWYIPKPSFMATVIAGFGVLLLLAPKAVPARYLGLLFILPIWLWRPLPPAINTAQVTVLDVGQGLAVVIRSHQHVVVYDTGPSYPEGFNSGLRVLWPYLRSLGINHIDRLIISHSDNDHAGGAKSLLNNMPALAIDSSDSHLFAEAKPCNAYQSWQWDGVQFNYLNVGGYKTHNANSCVLRIVVGEQQLLLPGDIGKTTEKQLLNHDSNALYASILIAPHHGSLSSSSMAFIEAVHPQYVVFATGKDNRFHFPKPQIVARYQQIGAKLYDTAKQGAIIFELSGKGDVAAPKTMLP